MRDTADCQTPPYGNTTDDFDEPAHYTKGGAGETIPQGRLVLVLERQLSDASRETLHSLLKNHPFYDDMTVISGLNRASIFQAEKLGNGLFYNKNEYLPLEEACRMLPWREVWVIANGLVWALQPGDTRFSA